MSIYTKVGDKGKTSTLNTKGRKTSKSSLVIHAIGSADEANSYIGICVSMLPKAKFSKEVSLLINIQNSLFSVGAYLAGSKISLEKSHIKELEDYIDEKEKILPVLNNFILPGGSEVSSHLMYARSLVRSLEREVVGLSSVKQIDPDVFVYLNRLSDLLFIISRFVNYKLHTKEKVWKGNDK